MLFRSGRDEFVVGNSDGYVRLFNGELNEEKVSQKFYKPIYVACVADINNDERLEVVCYIDSDRILVLDNNLNLLHEHLLEGRKLIRLTPFRREKDTLLFSRAGFPGQPAHYELLQFEESKFPFSDVNETRITNWLLIAGAFFIFLLLVIYLTRRGLLFHDFLHLLQQAQLYDQSLLLTKSRRIKVIGSKWVDILNNRSDSLVGKTLSKIESTNEPLVDLLKEMINSKQGERLFSATIDGEAKPIRIRVRFLPAVRLFNFLVFDITVQDHIKQIQLWAKVAQRLAHGIKNPLTSVKLNAEELREYLREKCLLDEEEVSDYIQSITNQVDKLKRMSDGFMRFVEFDKPQLKAYNINPLIEELVAQWKPTESSGIRIGLDLAEDVPTALLDKQQFIYAFQNIFFNAVQSIEGSGHIDISTRLLHSIAEVGAHKTAFVELRVQDTGVGIPPEYLDKITQPYFTTKKDGTGLGLSIVEKIVDSHDGMFDIQSHVDEGTTVTMRWRAKT